MISVHYPRGAASIDPQPALRGRLRPGWLITLLLLLFAAVWLPHLALTSLSPPTDNIEQLNWVHSLQWGYYKQPPLPTWLLWLPVQIFGVNAWTSYALGAVVNLATMGLLWRLMARIRGSTFATVALLAVLCISYYSAGLNAYNHNTLLTFWSTASAALCWRAVTSARLRWWAALGGVMGLGMLTKYQVAITMASVLAFWLTQRGWRDARQRQGLLLAALIALLVFTPHLQWLRSHDFGPVQYAVGSSLGAHLDLVGRVQVVSIWLGDQLLNRALPAWLLLAFLVYRSRRATLRLAPATPATPANPRPPDAVRCLLLCWGLIPLLFVPVTVLLAGSNVQMRWGAPFLLFAVPAAMELSAGRISWSRIPLRELVRAFAVIQLCLLLLSQLTSPHGPALLRDKHWRSFDSGALARLLEPAAHAALAGKPICTISGPGAIAGALALRFSDQPLVLIDGRYDHSPWVDAQKIRDCGMLQIGKDGPFPGAQPVGPLFPNLWWRVTTPALPQPVAAAVAK
jgi:4-amino-4-deoxy-L-arabinose transferase-like glycosyltransferase